MWLDYKKAYDLVPHNWIMAAHWKTNLTYSNTHFGKIDTKSRVTAFHLSCLLYPGVDPGVGKQAKYS